MPRTKSAGPENESLKTPKSHYWVLADNGGPSKIHSQNGNKMTWSKSEKQTVHSRESESDPAKYLQQKVNKQARQRPKARADYCPLYLPEPTETLVWKLSLSPKGLKRGDATIPMEKIVLKYIQDIRKKTLIPSADEESKRKSAKQSHCHRSTRLVINGKFVLTNYEISGFLAAKSTINKTRRETRDTRYARGTKPEEHKQKP
ncbi:hypothetical protein OS493_012466 [Desmophyllum pertusum]|uniref:Uncharacterized protein n=1 Tax=Desmophyllum pertusum TaxID=174260 RepID=A0A9W9ZQK8_9CNID|nr:hypothetical protein OS493_012466 [Desmophyllum pertusum]